MEPLDDVATGLIHHPHAVVPGRRNSLVGLAGRQERPGYTVDLRHVVPPELHERPEALGPASRRPVAAQPPGEPQNLVPVTYGRYHKLRPRAEVVVHRLPRNASSPGNIAHARAEAVVRDSGADLTILRSTWFMQNFSEDYMLEHVLSGEIRLPGGDVPTPFLDTDDIADVAVAALTEEGHVGQLYELTGPRSLTFAEAAAEIAEATGREIQYVPVSLEEHAAEAAEHGVPSEVVELLTYLFSEVVDGRNANTTDGVRRALGREPRDFADYAREAAATGVWGRAH